MKRTAQIVALALAGLLLAGPVAEARQRGRGGGGGRAAAGGGGRNGPPGGLRPTFNRAAAPGYRGGPPGSRSRQLRGTFNAAAGNRGTGPRQGPNSAGRGGLRYRFNAAARRPTVRDRFNAAAGRPKPRRLKDKFNAATPVLRLPGPKYGGSTSKKKNVPPPPPRHDPPSPSGP